MYLPTYHTTLECETMLSEGYRLDFSRHLIYFIDFLDGLRPFLPPAVINSAEDFIEEELRTGGYPEKDAPWNLKANVRNGYKKDIPGMISEIICAYRLYNYGTYSHIILPQDEYTQKHQKIDLIADNHYVQVKTVCSNNDGVEIFPEYVMGGANFLALVDISDPEFWMVQREEMIPFSGKVITLNELTELSAIYINSRKDYLF